MYITIPFINLKPSRSARYRYRIASALHESPPPSSGVLVPGVCGAKKCRESRNDRNHHPNGRNPDRGPMDQVAKEGGGGGKVGKEGKIRIHSSKTGGFNFFRFWRDFFFPDPKNGVTVTASFFNHRFFWYQLIHIAPMLDSWPFQGLDEDEWN